MIIVFTSISVIHNDKGVLFQKRVANWVACKRLRTHQVALGFKMVVGSSYQLNRCILVYLKISMFQSVTEVK